MGDDELHTADLQVPPQLLTSSQVGGADGAKLAAADSVDIDNLELGDKATMTIETTAGDIVLKNSRIGVGDTAEPSKLTLRPGIRVLLKGNTELDDVTLGVLGWLDTSGRILARILGAGPAPGVAAAEAE